MLNYSPSDSLTVRRLKFQSNFSFSLPALCHINILPQLAGLWRMKCGSNGELKYCWLAYGRNLN